MKKLKCFFRDQTNIRGCLKSRLQKGLVLARPEIKVFFELKAKIYYLQILMNKMIHIFYINYRHQLNVYINYNIKFSKIQFLNIRFKHTMLNIRSLPPSSIP